ncbi:glycosyltransferase family 4 protein [Nostoc sp.]|uniref:glycosyltransferase family 4 protein n=1 Tax=Nostoc sp. TaxID=1180 RepID=UPI002FF40DCC
MDKQFKNPNILVISRVFFPDIGGIQEYAYNRCLQDPESVIVLSSQCKNDKEFDHMEPFPIYRWSMPLLQNIGRFGTILKQILNMFWSVVLAIRLHQRYQYHYIEWCHGYDFPALLLLSYLLPVECFIYLHGDDVLCPQKNPVLRWLFEWTLQRTKKIVCNSNFTQDYLKEHFQVKRPIQIIHPTVRVEKFGQLNLNQEKLLRLQIRHKHQIPQEAIVILSVGRLVKRKGFDHIIKNLPALLAEGIDVYYLICGQGHMEFELRQLAENLGVTSRVIFAGYVIDEELAGYYAACDLFSMLSFLDTKSRSIEGFGIVYLEAGYFSKPVIASRVGGVVDAVFHGENGLLADPNYPEEILANIHYLCTDETLRQRLGKKGKELATRTTLHRMLYQFTA